MKLFAHRGASAYAPQNTIPSFKKALEMGVQGIELDVQLTADGVPVVIHDYYLEGTTDGKGFVHRQNWKELQKLDAGSWFSKDFTGTGIPALEEVLALVPKDVTLNVEIKSISSVSEPTAEIIGKILMQEKDRDLLISSFSHPVLQEMQSMDSSFKLGLLTGSDLINIPGYLDLVGLKPFSVHPEASCLRPDEIKAIQKRGWKCYSYTVNTKEQATMADALRIDGIFSDYPDLLS